MGVPQAFPIIDERQDAWVKYPREPVGSVWLIRQPAGSKPQVVAFTAECPTWAARSTWRPTARASSAPATPAASTFEGKPRNQIPPRPMDTLDVELSADPDPEVRVKFQRFRTATEEKIPLV